MDRSISKAARGDACEARARWGWRDTHGGSAGNGHATSRCGSRESRPVGAFVFLRDENPGLRGAPPWAMEYGPVGADGRCPHSTEGASFHSPGCNHTSVALKGRHSPDVSIDAQHQRVPTRLAINLVMLAAHGRRSWEWRPVGAYGFISVVNPGLRCAPPWAVELRTFGAMN